MVIGKANKEFFRRGVLPRKSDRMGSTRRTGEAGVMLRSRDAGG